MRLNYRGLFLNRAACDNVDSIRPEETDVMAKKPRQSKQPQTGRSKRIKLSPEESLKRVKEFDKRKEAFIAALRKGKNRSVSA